MGEIKTSDIQEINTPEKQEFKEIHPQEGMTPQEADKFWNKELGEWKSQDLSTDVYTDDNGKTYREGDKLVPNNKFEIDGFKYETDDEGRTTSVEGQLAISEKKPRDMDSMDVVGKGDNLDGDQRGHLIAHWFGGSDKLENLVPMSGELNQGEYAKMEHELADAVQDDADVHMKVEPIYRGDSNRPSEIKVTYRINGDTSVKVFRNGGNS